MKKIKTKIQIKSPLLYYYEVEGRKHKLEVNNSIRYLSPKFEKPISKILKNGN